MGKKKNKEEAIKMIDELRKSLEVDASSITTEEISGAPRKYTPRIYASHVSKIMPGEKRLKKESFWSKFRM